MGSECSTPLQRQIIFIAREKEVTHRNRSEMLREPDWLQLSYLNTVGTVGSL